MRVSLRAYLEALLTEMDRRYQQRFASHEATLNRIESGLGSHVDSATAFREDLSRKTAALPSQDQYAAMESLIDSIASRVDKLEGRSSGINLGWAYLIGTVAIFGAAITTFVAFKH